jgi:glycosyltransferase involved in cell wall biosynthesis
MVVRNEGDILGQTLRAAVAQLDGLLVVDCGSHDGSIEIIREIAANEPKLILAGCLRNQHPDEARAVLWSQARQYATARDWWVIIDADEFLEEGFREKIEQAAARGADHLFSAHANFYYTESERQDWLSGRESLANRSRPITERRRYYRMQTSMPRIFRNLPWLRWSVKDYLPGRLARAGSEQVIYRHYQYRDLPQIEQRVMTRQSLTFTPEFLAANPHWLLQKAGDAISRDDDPMLRRWSPGEPLEPDAELPRVPVSNLSKSAAKYALAIVEGLPFRSFSAPLYEQATISRLSVILSGAKGA